MLVGRCSHLADVVHVVPDGPQVADVLVATQDLHLKPVARRDMIVEVDESRWCLF